MLATDYLFLGEPSEFNLIAIIDDAFKLVDCLQELGDLFLVANLFRQDMPPTKSGEVALLLHPLLMGLGEEEVAAVMEERTLIEVPFRGSGEEPQVLPSLPIGQFLLIVLLDEPILLMHNGVIG